MAIESDRARIVGGVRHGRTLGAPVALLIENRDHAKWLVAMQSAPLAPGQDPGPAVTLPRPGHADLAGGLKYGASDLRDVLERASARETAARTALGAVARALLGAADIAVGSAVRSIGSGEPARPALEVLPEAASDAELLSLRADASAVRAVDSAREPAMLANIAAANELHTTVGGTFEVVATGLPPGLGSYAQGDRRLGSRLLAALGSIPAIKGAEVGAGFQAARDYGLEVHDAIVRRGPALRRSGNHAGGLEGGITNGEALVLRAAMKPIATQLDPLPSVDLATGTTGRGHVERSDTCAVPAASVVGEAVVALCLAEALLEDLGGDTVADLRARVRAAWRKARRLPAHVYLSGPSGAGKSTVGALVAQALGLPFVDLDREIEREAGVAIPEIFAREGEAGFRRREQAALERAAAGARAVIALGGGAETRRTARDVLRRTGDVLWLHAPVAILAARLAGDAVRPLLGPDPAAALERLERDRAEVRDFAADARVEAAGEPAHVAQRVLGALGALR
jgi:chorismate synthase